MNFDGFGGLALAVVAGLWLLVFVPSWFKRAQDRERGILPAPRAERVKRSKANGRRMPTRLVASDNFARLAAEYADSLGVDSDVAASEVAGVDPRAWQRNELPAPLAHLGTLESPQLATVVAFEEIRVAVEARKLSQAELDDILRRRRANG